MTYFQERGSLPEPLPKLLVPFRELIASAIYGLWCLTAGAQRKGAGPLLEGANSKT